MYYDYNDDTLLGKLNRKFGRYGIKNSMMILIIGMIVVWAMDYVLLRAEYFIIVASIAMLLMCEFLAAFLNIATYLRVILVIIGLLNVVVTFIVCVIIETKVGFYQCKKCGHKYIPTYSQSINSMHMGRTKYMKCPKCKQRSWNKKVAE